MKLKRALEIVEVSSDEEIRYARDRYTHELEHPLAAAVLTLVLHGRETGALADWAETIEKAALNDYSAGSNEMADRMLRSRPVVVTLLRALAGQDSWPDGNRVAREYIERQRNESSGA